jgi:hypothetical protein
VRVRVSTITVILGLFGLTDCDCGDELSSSLGAMHLELCDHDASCGCELVNTQGAKIDFGSPEANSVVTRTLLVLNDNAPKTLVINAIELNDPSGRFEITGIQKKSSGESDATYESHDMTDGALRLFNFEEAELYVSYTATDASAISAELTIKSNSSRLSTWNLTLQAGSSENYLAIDTQSCPLDGALNTTQLCGVDMGVHAEADIGLDVTTNLPKALSEATLLATNTTDRELFVGTTISADGVPETSANEQVGDFGVFFVDALQCTTLLPGEQISVLVTFRPFNPGSYEGELRFNGFGFDMRIGLKAKVTGAAVCIRTDDEAPDDATLVFGSAPDYTIAQNAVSVSRDIFVINCGYEATLDISNVVPTDVWNNGFSSTSLDPSWVVPSVPLNVGEEIAIPFVYAPELADAIGGQIEARLKISTNAFRGETFVDLQAGIGPPDTCILVAIPSPVDFGWIADSNPQLPIGGTPAQLSSTESLVLQNSGKLSCKNVTIDNIVMDPSSTGLFAVETDPNPSSFDLAPGESSQAFVLKFTAADTEDPVTHAGLLPFRSDDSLILNAGGACPADHYCLKLEAKSGGDPECELTYQPVQPPGFLCPMETVAFGNVNIGQSKTLDLKLTNTGSEQCTVTQFALSSTTSPSFTMVAPSLPLSLPVNDHAFIPLTFTPIPPSGNNPFEEIGFGCLFGGMGFPGTGGGGGNQSVLVNYYSGTATTQGTSDELALSGKGTQPDIDVIPGQIDFGEVTVGCCSAVREVTIYNSGDGDLTINSVGVLGSSSPGFYIIDQPSVSVVTPNNSTTFSAHYCPPSVGQSSGVIEILSTDGDDEQYTVPVTGTGTLDSEGDDTFIQPARPMVDVLWTVDDSGSMSDDQQNLANNFDGFIDSALGLDTDYHIGVVNTDVESEYAGMLYTCSGPLWISDTQTTADQRNQFRCNVKTSDWPRPASDAKESPLQAARLALDYPNLTDHNAGFYREEAKLYIIAVTDEEDQSDGTPQQYVDFFQNLKGIGNPELLNISAISGPPPDGCGSGNNEVPANQFDYDAVEAVGGQFKSICSNDWTDLVASLGLDVFNSRAQFALSRPATATTIQVTVCDPGPANCQVVPQEDTNGWSFDGNVNAVTFHGTSIPGPNKEIQVTYTAICYPPQ